jgi:hypothetical protein
MPMRKIFPTESILETLQAHGLKLMDFGQQCVLPVTDKTGGYLTSTMLVIVPMKAPEGNKIRVLPITWWKDVAPARPVIEYAAKNFDQFSIEIDGGGPLPSTYTEDFFLEKAKTP